MNWEVLIGLDTIKESLSEMITWHLHHLERLQHFSVTSAQSCLLLGPARRGKTSLVTELARLLAISLVYVRASELIRQGGSNAEYTLYQAFRKARQTSPSLIVIDNFEQVISYTDTNTDLLQRLLNQLQYELDEQRQIFLVVVARTDHQRTTTAPLEQSQTFSTIIRIPSPNPGDIAQIIHKRIGHILEPEVSVERIAQALAGATVSEVVRICEESGKITLRECFDASYIAEAHIWRVIEQFKPTSQQ